MQPIPRLALNRIRIRLERLYLLFQPQIILLQLRNPLLNRPIFRTPLLVDSHAILTKDCVIPKHHSRRDHRAGSDTPPHPVYRLPNPLQPSRLLLPPAQ